MYEIYEKFRNIKGLTDTDVSRISGVSRATFSAWKQNEYTPKLEKLKKIADALDINVSQLSGEIPESKNDFSEEIGIMFAKIYSDPELIDIIKLLIEMDGEARGKCYDYIFNEWFWSHTLLIEDLKNKNDSERLAEYLKKYKEFRKKLH